jgi:hypothetical protein
VPPAALWSRDDGRQAGLAAAPVPNARCARVALWAWPGREAEAGSSQQHRIRPVPLGSRAPNRLGGVREERLHPTYGFAEKDAASALPCRPRFAAFVHPRAVTAGRRRPPPGVDASQCRRVLRSAAQIRSHRHEVLAALQV